MMALETMSKSRCPLIILLREIWKHSVEDNKIAEFDDKIRPMITQSPNDMSDSDFR